MSIIRKLVVLLLIVCCCSCGSNGKNSSNVSESITFKSGTPGNAAQGMFYTESTSISGNTITVVRTGGSEVNSGTWSNNMDPDEIATINDLVSRLIKPEVNDTVSDTIVYDASVSSLQIGDKNFNSGMVLTPSTGNYQWHELPADAKSLVSFIDELILKYCGKRYKN